MRVKSIHWKLFRSLENNEARHDAFSLLQARDATISMNNSFYVSDTWDILYPKEAA